MRKFRKRVVQARTETGGAPFVSSVVDDVSLAKSAEVEEREIDVVSAPSDDFQSFDATLVSNFTHQIVNPLNGVVGTLDNIIDGTIAKDKSERKLRACRAQLQVAIELVRNLAYLSELSTQEGRDGLGRKAVDVSLPKVIVESMQTLQGSAQHRNIDVHLDGQDIQYVVRGHKDLLRQVFLNLIENGIKYGSNDSRIVIDSHIQKKSDQLIVRVESTGTFVPADERERIFERGVRGSGGRDRLASGSGIGLFICRQILALYGASIACESSESGPTTVFMIRFPHGRIDETETERVRNARRK